jgi:predicted 3-demethylubiquinone-9 3-methyltransferase (glyoxalase superfamily)
MPNKKEQNKMQKITPFLWFDTEAEEAMNLYVSVFKNSKVLGVTPGPNGRAMSVNFELEGQEFIGLNAGPSSFTEGSVPVNCSTQEK